MTQVRAEPGRESRPPASDPTAGRGACTVAGPVRAAHPHAIWAPRVPGAGVPAGTLGAAAAGAAPSATASAPPLGQQREVGGDPGGGRRQDGGVPRAATRRELHADHHEHGEAAAGGGQWWRGASAWEAGCRAQAHGHGCRAGPRHPSGASPSRTLCGGCCQAHLSVLWFIQPDFLQGAYLPPSLK